MSEIEIVNPVPLEDAAAWFATMASTLLRDPSSERYLDRLVAERRHWDGERCWAARDGDRIVGTLASLPLRLTVPGGEAPGGAAPGSELGGEVAGDEPGGGELPVDGITQVAVAATHRRRGVMRELMAHAARAAIERGDPVSALFAAEWPIYGRFGYAPATQEARYTLWPRRAGPVFGDDPGAVRQVSAEELGEFGPAVFAAARRRWAGNIDRPEPWWESTLGLRGQPADREPGEPAPTHVAHIGPDGPDGFAWWAPTRHYDLDGTLAEVVVGDLQAATDEAYRALWRYLAGIDLVGRIEFARRPVDEPARWLLADGRALRQSYAGDALWLRLLDVPAALTARRYACAGRLVVEVVDDCADGASGERGGAAGGGPAGPAARRGPGAAPGSASELGPGPAAGRYLLDGGPDGASCVRAPARTPDLRLDQRALAAAYLGGFSLRQQRVAGRIEEQTSGAVRTFDAMLATDQAPWCATMF
ncbi:MAG: GNAT family N-acetyltransferase [Actinomycetia bacterium]|nr:GNAT family N-acetyltransferase [Actinomycetes bacterium]